MMHVCAINVRRLYVHIDSRGYVNGTRRKRIDGWNRNERDGWTAFVKTVWACLCLMPKEMPAIFGSLLYTRWAVNESCRQASFNVRMASVGKTLQKNCSRWRRSCTSVFTSRSTCWLTAVSLSPQLTSSTHSLCDSVTVLGLETVQCVDKWYVTGCQWISELSVRTFIVIWQLLLTDWLFKLFQILFLCEMFQEMWVK